MSRWFFATTLVLAGCFFCIASPLIGSGVHVDPDPTAGMLIAGPALAVMIGGYWLIRWEKRASILANLINVVLILGTLRLVYGVLQWAGVQWSQWTDLRPGDVLFSVSYGILSVAGLATLSYWARKPAR